MRKGKLRAGWDRLGRDELRALQGDQLHRFLAREVLPFSGYYRALFKEQGLAADDIRNLDDLARIPFSSKADLLNTPEHPQRARDFVLIPDQEVLRKRPGVIWKGITRGRTRAREALERVYRPVFLTSTTGRSAEPVPFLYTNYDLDILSDCGSRLVEVLGAQPDHRILNMFPYAPHLAFWQVHYCSTSANVFCLSTGGGKTMGTAGNLRLLRSMKPNNLIGMPTFLYHFLQMALEEEIRCPQLRNIVLGGEKVPEGMRRKLKSMAEALGAEEEVRVVATYGFTEAKVACGECSFSVGQTPPGYHTYPDLQVFEIVHPETGEVLPDGSPGEIVYTAIDGRGTVVIRYRTGDFLDGGITHEPCPCCGRLGPRLVGRISRASNFRELRIDKVKGTLVNFNDLEHALDDAEYIGAWVIELRKVDNDPLGLDEVILHAQKIADLSDEEAVERLNRKFASLTQMRFNQILFHDAPRMRRLQGLEREIKERRLVDHRPKEAGEEPPSFGPTPAKEGA